jgi:hypothetical protein
MGGAASSKSSIPQSEACARQAIADDMDLNEKTNEEKLKEDIWDVCFQYYVKSSRY